MNIQNDEEYMVYDLIEYKLKRWVDSFYLDSEEWHHAMHILAAYLEGEISVQWADNKIQITILDPKSDLQINKKIT